MSGELNEVQAKFRDNVLHAVYVDCHVYRLKLILNYCLRNISELYGIFLCGAETLYIFIIEK